jgi:hypothetical protein
VHCKIFSSIPGLYLANATLPVVTTKKYIQILFNIPRDCVGVCVHNYPQLKTTGLEDKGMIVQYNLLPYR